MCRRLLVGALVALAALGVALPAHAGSGGPSHTVPLLAGTPAIDGNVGTLEWSGANSFSASFGSMSGTVWVGRDATTLYVAAAIQDPAGSAGDTDIFFDNNDDDAIQIGEDLIVLTGTQAADFALGGVDAYFMDTSLGGTSDVQAAGSYASGVAYVEYSHPLCSADTTHDICFNPPATESSPFSKVGFTFGYRTADQSFTGFYPASIGDPQHWGNFVIPPPDTTPPTLNFENPTGGRINAATDFRAAASDTGTGVAQVEFQYNVSIDPPGAWKAIGSASSPDTDGRYHVLWNDRPPDGRYYVRAVARDQLGNTSSSGARQITLDTQGPQINLSCMDALENPAPCKWFTLPGQLPMMVTHTETDAAGITDLLYTTDGSDPLAPNNPAASPLIGTVQLSASALVRAAGRDSLGNESQYSVDVGIDTSPPETPTLRLANAQGAYLDGAQLWLGGDGGHFTLFADGGDPESGIELASLPSADSFGSGWTHETDTNVSRTYTFTPGADLPPDIWPVSLTNNAGLTSDPTEFAFERDTTPPAGQVSCAPSACASSNGPVTVSFDAHDIGSGVATTIYTTDGSDPSATNGTHATSVAIESSNTTVKWIAIDNVGNLTEPQSVTVTEASPAPQNVLQNGGFEQPLQDPQRGTSLPDGSNAVHPALGNWQPYAQSNNQTYPSRQDVPFAGSFSGHTLGGDPGGDIGGKGSTFWQDAPATFQPNQGYALEAYVLELQGVNQVLSTFDSDRDSGQSVGSAGFTFTPQSLSFSAWGRSATADAPSLFGAWHLVRLEAYADHTSALFVDGVKVGSIATPGQAIPLQTGFPLAETAVILGDSDGGAHFGTEAYFDNVALYQFAAPADSAQGGPTFTVNTAADHLDTTGCTVNDCTLREAITAANASDPDATIDFAIPTPAPTIQLASPLPAITHSTDLDGRTQGGALGPAVTIDCRFDTFGDGLLLQASNSSIRGFVVQHCNGIGIHVLGGTNNNVSGNWVGLDPTGTTAAGNGGDGIRIENSSNDYVVNNAVAANGGHGIFLLNTTVSFVRNNKSGTNAAGTQALGNGLDGIAIDGGGGNAIGGFEAEGNLVGGNHHQGIAVFGVSYDNTSTNDVIGNDVGITPQGIRIPNAGDGIRMFNANWTTVSQNVVVGNGAAGVSVLAASNDNAIRRNSIYDNGGLGIDLGGDGVTPNDVGDGDVGPNALQNFPGSIGGASLSDGSLTVSAKLLSTPQTSFTIDVYASATCDPSRFGEGRIWLGQISTLSDGKGEAVIAGAVSGNVAEGDVVTFTATEQTSNNTSEFSPCTTATAAGRATDDGTTLTLADDATTSPPGATVVGLDTLSLSSVPPPTGSLGSAPLAAVDMRSLPLAAVPLAAVPLAAVPLAAVGISVDAANAIGGIPLTELPLIPPDSWTTRLAGTVLAGLPVQNITFSQVLQLAPQAVDGSLPGKPALTMRSVDVRNSILATVPLAAVALGSVKLTDIPTVNWCDAYAQAGITPCPDLSKQTVISAALQGVPLAAVGFESVPLAAVNLAFSPLAAVPLAAVHITGTPLAAVPLAAVSVAGSPLAAVPLAAVAAKSSAIAALPLAAVPLAAVDCSKIGGGCKPTTTIGEAAAAGALNGVTLLQIAGSLGNLTLGDIADFLATATFTVGDLAPFLPTTITLRDLLLALLPIANWNWEGADLPALDIQDHATQGGLVHETATFSVAGSGGKANVDLKVTLPSGARYVKGSSSLTPGAAAPPDPDKTSGNVLTWHLTGLIFGTQYQLQFSQRPGLVLGHEDASASLDSNGLTAPKTSSPAADVLLTDASLEPNDTPATARPIAIDTLALGYITSASDVDDYTFNGAPGARYVIRLSHLHFDGDMLVYGPQQQQLRSAPLAAVPLAAVQLGDPGAGPGTATASLAPQNLGDAPRADLPLLGASLNRGTDDESVLVLSTGAGGPITIQISGFNGASSQSPYVLRVQQLAAPVLPACSPRSPSGGAAGTLPALSTFNGAKALFLVNGKRIGDFYGAQAENDVLNAIQSRITAGDFNKIGFPAGIVRLDGSSDIQTAYDAWDQNSCSPDLADNVATKIGTLIDGLRAADPALRYLVLVGSDPIIPMARLLDYTTLSNEADFAGTFTTNNEYLGALGNGYMLSDAPYGSGQPQPYFNRQIYTPDLSVGRLVETPQDIVNQIGAFFGSNATIDPATAGTVNPTSSFTTGYDFLTDGATAVADRLHTGIGNDDRLINETWTKQNALDKIFPAGAASPGVVALNAHYDQSNALPAIGNQTHSLADLVSTTNFDGRTAPDGSPALRRHILFTMGCHAGYNIAGVVVPSLDADWPQTLATQQAVYLANTTYGLGDTATVAYSEQYMANFARYLDGTMTVGEAQMNAAADYFSSLGMISPYDEKAGEAPTLYGMPMYRFQTSKAAPPPPAQVATQTDAVTGLTAASVGSTPTFVFHHTGTGDFYTDGANTPQTTLYQPLEPRSAPTDVTQPGTLAHGVRIDSLVVLRTEAITPHYNRPTADQGANEPPFIPQNAAFPDNLAAVTTVNTPNGRRQQVVFLTGAFDGTAAPGAAGAGTQTLFSSVGATVLYSQGTDWTPPSITRVDSIVVPGRVSFTVQASDTGLASSVPAPGVASVTVMYRDGTSQSYTPLTLTLSNGVWTGSGPATTTTIEYFVQGIDRSGNTVITRNKARNFNAAPPTGGTSSTITTHVNGAAPVQGKFYNASPVVVDASTTSNGLRYSVDGGPLTDYAGAISVTGDGPHSVHFADSVSSTDVFFGIDTSPPTVTISTPRDNAILFILDKYTVDFGCKDAGAGVASCVGTLPNGSQLPTLKLPGTYTFKVTATDTFGRATTATSTYVLVPGITFLPPALGDPILPVLNIAKAGSTVPVHFSLLSNRGLDIFDPGYPRSQQVACPTNIPQHSIDPQTTATGLSYDSRTTVYTYGFKTDPSWVGTCRLFSVKFRSGSVRTIRFKFR